MEEFEVKFLKIDPVETRKKLKKLGAKKVFERLFRRKIYDYPDWRLNSGGSWLRIRDEGEQVTMTYKQRLGKNLDSTGKINDEGMEEVEVVVDNFENTCLIFEKIGFVCKRYIENRRERWKLNDVTFDLDTYPLIPTYLEIETTSWEKIDEMILSLKLDPKEKKIFSGKQVYMNYGIDENDYDVITFENQVKKGE